jgi:hypothetical protein
MEVVPLVRADFGEGGGLVEVEDLDASSSI